MSDDSNDTSERSDHRASDTKLNYHNLARISAPVITFIAVFAEKSPPRDLVILLASVLAGAFLWKIPPFEVGPPPGIHNGFISATLDRMKSACLATATWAGVGAVFGVFAGAAVAGLAFPGRFLDSAGYGATWGTLVFGLIGASVWTFTRTIDDAKYLMRTK